LSQGREILVELDRVSFRYRLARQRIGSIKEYAIHWVRGTLSYEWFWAVRDVSLTIGRGEAVGLVGRNGAGKSTLLRLVSGVLKPTLGSVKVQGRVTPVLELGAGFDGELTGRENVFLYGVLLGYSRREIRKRLPEIAAFSELEEFLDVPVRAYSSGMLARLAYAVATAWPPEILLIDEALAVGDASFAAKCFKRQRKFQEDGATVLLVSHDVETLKLMTERAVWLEQGQVLLEGPTPEVVARYLEAAERSRLQSGELPDASGKLVAMS
jgi:ABC-type polysaccharide/polyol phosphate transport system ATPase subunit